LNQYLIWVVFSLPFIDTIEVKTIDDVEELDQEEHSSESFASFASLDLSQINKTQDPLVESILTPSITPIAEMSNDKVFANNDHDSYASDFDEAEESIDVDESQPDIHTTIKDTESRFVAGDNRIGGANTSKIINLSGLDTNTATLIGTGHEEEVENEDDDDSFVEDGELQFENVLERNHAEVSADGMGDTNKFPSNEFTSKINRNLDSDRSDASRTIEESAEDASVKITSPRQPEDAVDNDDVDADSFNEETMPVGEGLEASRAESSFAEDSTKSLDLEESGDTLESLGGKGITSFTFEYRIVYNLNRK
jgi:hypothetical protein